MTRQAKILSVMFATLIFLIISEFYIKYRSGMNEKDLKKNRQFISVVVILMLLSTLFFITDSAKDFFIAFGLLALTIFYYYILVKEPRIGEIPMLLLNFLFWIFWFFIRNAVNRHTLIPINYSIIIVFIINIVQINLKKDKSVAKKYFLANGLGVVVLSIMIFFTNDSYIGVSKQEYLALEYMEEVYKYERSQVEDLSRIQAIKGEDKVVVSIKGEDKYYLLTYKDGQIDGVQEFK